MPYLEPTTQSLPFQSESETSRDAAVRAKSFVGKQGADVFGWVEARGELGATMAEAEREMPIRRSSACARFNALAKEKAGRFVKTTEKRDGCFVYIVVGHR